MNKTVIFRMTSTASYQLSGLRAGEQVLNVNFTRSYKVANGTRSLYGHYTTDNVEVVKAMLNHNAFRKGFYTLSAHENDAEYIKKVFGLEIKDLGVSQKKKIAEMQSTSELDDLKVKYNVVVAERDALALRIVGYEKATTNKEKDDSIKTTNIIIKKKEPTEDDLKPTADITTDLDDKPVVYENIPCGEGVSNEDLQAACHTLKTYNFETQKNFNQLRAIAKFFGIEGNSAADYIAKLTAVKELL